MKTSPLMTLLCLFCLPLSVARADHELSARIAAEVAFEPTPWFQFSVAPEVRFRDDAPGFSDFITTFGTKFDATKWLKFDLAYRIRFSQSIGLLPEFEFRHRIHVSVDLQGKIGDFQLRSRTRFQTQFRPEEELNRRFTLRQQFRIRWRATREVRPHFSAETHLRIADTNGTEFWQERMILGIDFEVGPFTVDVGYGIDIPLGSNEDHRHLIIIDLGYTYEPPEEEEQEAEPTEEAVMPEDGLDQAIDLEDTRFEAPQPDPAS